MIRVGYLFEGGDGWLGGVNYLWNLLFAVCANRERTLQPVLVVRGDLELHGLDGIEGVEVVRLPSGPGPSLLLRSVRRRLLGRDPDVVAMARALDLAVLSHSGTFGWRMPVATLPWVPDLQHRRLPDFFSFEERRTRDYGALHQLLEGDRVIVSSEAAAADLRRFYGPAASRLSVLRFVSQPRMAVDELPTLADLRQRWELPERYFFLPNQFWRHKNHAVVLQALVLATKRGVELSVVATGKGEDYRAPGHYRELMQQVADAGLERQFRHLGMVSYPDLQGLMRDAIAVVNPSLFEGWSTTVEEARSLGKATVLSDIDVHREQSPPGSHFFPAADTNALADVLIDLWLQRSADDDARRLAASAALSARTFEFARTYQRIVGDAIERRSHR